MSHINPIHTIPSYSSKIHSPTSWSSQWSLSFWLSHKYPICIPLRSSLCYTPCPSHPPWLDHSNYTWRRVQVMKLVVMQFSPTSCHFIKFLKNNTNNVFRNRIKRLKFTLETGRYVSYRIRRARKTASCLLGSRFFLRLPYRNDLT
jgi:hypothetical protein